MSKPEESKGEAPVLEVVADAWAILWASYVRSQAQEAGEEEVDQAA